MKSSKFRSLAAAAFVVVFLFAGGLYAQEKIVWHDIAKFGIEGKGWKDTAHLYDRLPAKAERTVRPEVWNLSQKSAGLSVRFVTDAQTISVRWSLRGAALDLPNLPAAAMSGVDLYVREGTKWRWAGAARPDKQNGNERKIVENMMPGRREFRLYLPLYNGTERAEIGVPEGAAVAAAPASPQKLKPVVIYGTSIVQGASASRPGMAYPAILERRLNRPFVNLGFSGNGKMEAELAELLAEIDAAVYVIDCLPNLSTGEEAEQRAVSLVEILRKTRPNTPIVLVENVNYPDLFIDQAKRKKIADKNAGLQRAYLRLRESRVRNLHYISADRLLPLDGEGTIDGVHPNDHGFMHMADAIGPVLRRVLTGPQAPRRQR
jgi:lysophospholipase L1-like esterase